MEPILGEKKLRIKNQVTVPLDVVDVLNLSIGDYIRFERNNGNIVICKAITRKIPNNCGSVEATKEKKNAEGDGEDGNINNS